VCVTERGRFRVGGGAGGGGGRVGGGGGGSVITSEHGERTMMTPSWV